MSPTKMFSIREALSYDHLKETLSSPSLILKREETKDLTKRAWHLPRMQLHTDTKGPEPSLGTPQCNQRKDLLSSEWLDTSHPHPRPSFTLPIGPAAAKCDTTIPGHMHSFQRKPQPIGVGRQDSQTPQFLITSLQGSSWASSLF